jgi:hypothetical protein
MPSTYEPIATTTVAVATTSISFTSIPSTYTDIRLVWTVRATAAGNFPTVRFNNDSGSNYSWTRIYGDGTSAASQRNTSRTGIGILWLDEVSSAADTFNLLTLDVFSYAGSTYKTSLTTASADKNGSGTVERAVALWRSTSAINQIDLISGSSTFAAGTTATLYGIKNA